VLTYLKAGTVKRIHVNRQVIAQNRTSGANEPAVTVQTSKGPHRARRAVVLGHSEMVQAGPVISEVDGSLIRTIKPLSCGARVWLETRAAVEVIE
jgi:hypothetical protein